MSNTRRRKADQPPSQYSPGWLDALDYRTQLARDLRARFDEVCTDLGGADQLSYMQRSLVERALWLEFWLSQQEQALAKGQEFDVGKWVQAANSLQGIYSRLGLERKQREAPDLQTFLKQRGGDG